MKGKLYCLLLIVACIFSGNVSASKVKYIDLEVDGSGVSLHAAVNNALINAIAQVHGKSIESERISKSMEASISSKTDEAYLASEAYIEGIKEKTKGAVSSYRILKKQETSAGNWRVTLSVKVSQYKKSKSSNRMRLVVTSFHADSLDFSVANNQTKSASVTNLLSQNISNNLVQTRKFTVLDRSFTNKVDDELSLASSNKVSVDESARLGQKLVADYVLVGNVVDYKYVTKKKKMRTSDRTYETGSGVFKAMFKVVETATQQTVFSDSVSVKATHKQLSKAGASDSKSITDYFTHKLALKISSKVQSHLYPLAIIASDGDEVVLSHGGSSLKVGEQYKVFKAGKKLYDPYTKEFLGRKESFFGVVTITNVTSKVSYGKLTQNAEAISMEVPKKTYILRNKIVAKKVKKRKPLPKKVNDDNW